MNNQKILFWDSSVSDMKQGRQFGGIAVQLNFWMQVFGDNGWEIHTLTKADSYVNNGVSYHHIRHFQSIELAWEWYSLYNIIKRVRPQLIVFRGAKRQLYPLSLIGRHFGAKVILQGASDVNFEPGKAAVGNCINRRLYEAALHKVDYIVCQNNFQASALKNNFGRDSLVIPNIWGRLAQPSKPDVPASDVVWVGNFRRLKRPEWFYEAARALPETKFAIAGGATVSEYFIRMAREANSIPNLEFLGQISIEDSNELITGAKILVCSSEYEGFPNTFLQAWAAGIPVVSTVDPDNLIKTYNLGLTADRSKSLTEAIRRLLSDEAIYKSTQQSIRNYFSDHHSSQKCYDVIIGYITE